MIVQYLQATFRLTQFFFKLVFVQVEKIFLLFLAKNVIKINFGFLYFFLKLDLPDTDREKFNLDKQICSTDQIFAKMRILVMTPHVYLNSDNVERK